jgi:hypothetical protein
MKHKVIRHDFTHQVIEVVVDLRPFGTPKTRSKIPAGTAMFVVGFRNLDKNPSMIRIGAKHSGSLNRCDRPHLQQRGVSI